MRARAALLVTLGLPLGCGGGADVAIPDPVTERMSAPVAQAITRARAAVVANPGDGAAWGELAEVLDAHHLYDEALVCYDEAIARRPDEFRWAYDAAVVSDFSGAEPGEVVGRFDRALALAPEYPPGWVRYGDALVRLGENERARDAYARAAELDPDFAMALRGLGQTLLALGEHAQALGPLQRAADLAPGDSVARAGLAQAYGALGNERLAELASLEANERRPEHGLPDPVRFAVDDRAMTPAGAQRRAREHFRAGRHAEGIAELELVVSMVPADARLRHELGVALLRTGAAQRGEEELLEAARLDPGRFTTQLELGGLRERQGRLDEAIAFYRKAVELAPGDARGHKRLAMALGASGALGEAVVELRLAREHGPPDAEVLHNLGTALDRLGRREEAQESFRAALALDPDNPYTRFNLGLSLEASGKRGEALAEYRRAAALDADGPAAARLAELGG